MAVIGRRDNGRDTHLVMERVGWRIVAVTLWQGDEPIDLTGTATRIEVIEDASGGPLARIEIPARTTILERASPGSDEGQVPGQLGAFEP